MLKNKTIAVVVPAFNEEQQIVKVLESMPDFVDRIVVVNDCSTDNTSIKIKEYIKNNPQQAIDLQRFSKNVLPDKYNYADIIAEEMRIQEEKYYIATKEYIHNYGNRIILLEHEYNAGIGGCIATGYKWCRDNNIECTAIMGGDGQMDPSELLSICKPIVNGEADYVKGNRLIHKAASLTIPKVRYFGNSILSILTKMASGYWHVSDSQTGFTAISNVALNGIELHKIYRSYGVPNDLLVKLNIGAFTIKEVPIKPVYKIGEISKMKVWKVIPRIALLLLISFHNRLIKKYLFRSFHPLFICYLVFYIISLLNIFLFIDIAVDYFIYDVVKKNRLIIFLFSVLLSAQFLLFGMWFDMQDNERLQK